MADATSTSTKTGSALLQNVVAQATTVVALLVAATYACGALVFIVRLSLLDLPATSVLGQLPHNLLLTTGVTEVLLPVLVGGTLLAVWIPPESLLPHRPLNVAMCQLGVVSVTLTMTVGAAYGWARGRAFLPGVLRHSVLWVVVPTLVLTLGLLTGALFASRRLPRSQKGRRFWAACFFAAALVPGCAAAFGTTPLPRVFVCRNKDFVPLSFSGDLIGTSSGNYYIAQFLKTGERAEDRRILVLPQDQTRFITLARDETTPDGCVP